MRRVARILVFTVLSVGFPYFTNAVQVLCSRCCWLHLNCSSTGTGFNEAEPNSRIAHNVGILLMNSNCFAIFFQQDYSYVCSDIYKQDSSPMCRLCVEREEFVSHIVAAVEEISSKAI